MTKSYDIEEPTLENAIAFILSANSDEMQKIWVAAKERHGQLRQIRKVNALTRFKTGDRVKLGGTIGPKYLHGVPGVIEGMEGDRFCVRLEYAVRRYSGVVRVPADCLEAND